MILGLHINPEAITLPRSRPIALISQHYHAWRDRLSGIERFLGKSDRP